MARATIPSRWRLHLRSSTTPSVTTAAPYVPFSFAAAAVIVVSAVVLLLLSAAQQAAAIENRCSACIVIAKELLTVLSEEKPRNHLDMRNRLNSQGKREGKVIDYRVSELRAVEILDGLCKRVEKYGLRPSYKGKKKVWAPTHEINKVTDRLRLIADEQGKEIKRWCERLVEEEEEEITELIRAGELNPEVNVPSKLCQTVTDHCKGDALEAETERMKEPERPKTPPRPPPKDANSDSETASDGADSSAPSQEAPPEVASGELGEADSARGAAGTASAAEGAKEEL